MEDLIELSCLTAAFKDIDKMLTEPFDDEMNNPTPCPGWDVRTLVEHVVDLVVRIGHAAGITVRDQVRVTPQQRVAAALESVIDGWQRRGMNGEVIWRDWRLSQRVAINVLTLDVVVHGWDLAAALDRTLDIADPYLDYLLHFARGALVYSESSVHAPALTARSTRRCGGRSWWTDTQLTCSPRINARPSPESLPNPTVSLSRHVTVVRDG